MGMTFLDAADEVESVIVGWCAGLTLVTCVLAAQTVNNKANIRRLNSNVKKLNNKIDQQYMGTIEDLNDMDHRMNMMYARTQEHISNLNSRIDTLSGVRPANVVPFNSTMDIEARLGRIESQLSM